MFTKSDISRNTYMLTGKLARKGFDCWQHSFTGRHIRTGEEKTFFIEYFLCNPNLAANRPVLGQSPENRDVGKPPSYLMIKAGCWGKNPRQMHRFFAWKKVSLHETAPFSVKAADCLVSETYLKGIVNVSPAEAERYPEYMCQSGFMSWHLQVAKKIAFHTGFRAGSLCRTAYLFNHFRHTEGMKTQYEGSVILDGEEYQVLPENSYGYAGKIWGSDLNPLQMWLSSCDLLSSKTGKRLTNSAFEITGANPKFLFRRLRNKFMGGFYYEGQPFEFHFLKFWHLPTTRFYCREAEDELIWHVRQESLRSLVKIEVHCSKEEMLFLNYEAPDGTAYKNRIFSGGTGTGFIRLYKKSGTRQTLVDEIVTHHVRCAYTRAPKDA